MNDIDLLPTGKHLQFGKPSPLLGGMQCIRCHRRWPVGDYFVGCPACAGTDSPANVAPWFLKWPSLCAKEDLPFWFAYPGSPCLGEGNTPLLDFPVLAKQHGLCSLMLKNEGANPTGSHKDRMSTGLVRRALDIGATTVAVASSGNAGVSLAAFAANAGLDCVVVTTEGMQPGVEKAIRLHGADIIVAASAQKRWDLIRDRSLSGEWYPATNFTIPAVGSNPFAIDGLRAIALELYLELGADQPSDVIVPVSRGDVLWGIAQGYRDLVANGLLSSVPRIHAAEPFPRITRVLTGAPYTAVFDGVTRLRSLGGNTVTYQALEALECSGGTVVAPDEADTLAAQVALGEMGLYVENASAITLSALIELRRRTIIAPDASVVLIATSHGYTDVP